ncbi:MAG: hypothetical protein ACFFG0_02485 [Candidatus Thorarchaeota archaeon]
MMNDKLYDLFDSRLSQIETGISSLNKKIDSLEIKINGLVEHNIAQKKDIEYLQKDVAELKQSTCKEFDIVWEDGIRKTKTELITSQEKGQEDLLKTVKGMVERKVLRERLALYGAIIAILISILKWVLN